LRKFSLETDERVLGETPEASITHSPKCAALSYCGKWLVTGDDQNELKVWSTEDWSL